VIERFYQAIKYEHLYRHEIGGGLTLAKEVDHHLPIHNSVRPDEAIGFFFFFFFFFPPRLPRTCTPCPPRQGANLKAPATVSDS
jgi:hypothetical protein